MIILYYFFIFLYNIYIRGEYMKLTNDEKLDFRDFKLDIVGSLVESITHQIQANLLLISASLDVIKMLNEDKSTQDNKEKKEVLDNLYLKNSLSIQRANLLLELMSEATNISNESIMQYNDIVQMLRLILDEQLKQDNVILNIEEKIRNNTYICGPLNDVIFIICKIITEFIINGNKEINLKITEDENNWYFKVTASEISSSNMKYLSTIKEYISQINGVKIDIKGNNVKIEINKIR